MTRYGCAALVLVLLASCDGARGGVSNPPLPTGCMPGASEACMCASGTPSMRVCQDDGTFGVCVCPGEDATVSMDATALPDLPGNDLTLPDLPQSEPTLPDLPVRPDTPGLTCSAPRLDCDNNPANGCETDTTTSTSHCGRCNSPCAAGRSCVGGACSCAAGSTVCSGSCVNTQTDPAHCGACGVRCNTGETCAAGRCNPPAGMCPSSCRVEADCAPCRTPGDPGNYCCISGLCLYMTGACMSPAPDASVGPDVPDSGGGTGGGDASAG